MAEDRESGIRMRFVEGWDISPDQNPHAFSMLVCPECLAQIVGAGVSLAESMADADDKFTAHKCSHLKGAE